MYKGNGKKSVLLSALMALMLLVGSVVCYAAVKAKVWKCQRCGTEYHYSSGPRVSPDLDPYIPDKTPCVDPMGYRYSKHVWVPEGDIVNE